MARDYARIMTAIWNNDAFVALSEPEQRAYLLLITQPDISAAGVLRLWVPRWAEMSATSSVEELTQALKGLETQRFIVLDLTAGELLIRSFIKWDAGYNNTKRKPVIRRAREEVRSSRIREYLDVDFVRFGLDDPPPGGGQAKPTDGPSTSTRRHVDRASDSPSGPDLPDPAETASVHVDGLSDRTSTSDGVVVTSVSTGEPHSLNPQTADADASDADEPHRAELTVIHGGTEPPNAQSIVGRWIDAFVGASGFQPTKSQKGHAARDIKQFLDAGNDPWRVQACAVAAGRKCQAAVQNEIASAVASQRKPARHTSTDKIANLQAMKNGSDAQAWPIPRSEFQ